MFAVLGALLFSMQARAAEFSFVVEGVEVQLLVTPELPAAGADGVRRWVRRAIEAHVRYAGGFPVEAAYIAVRSMPGRGIYGGKAFATDPPVVNIQLGAGTTDSELSRDWVLVHELAHLAMPSLPRRYRWFEEGFAGYVEAMARLGAGMRPAPDTWQALVRGVAQGSRFPGEGGLHGASRWGRVYWESTSVMLRIDVSAHQLTGRGWQEILADWRRRGWDISSEVSFETLVAAADEALGVRTVSEYTLRYGERAGPQSMQEIWAALGVGRQPGDGDIVASGVEADLRRSLYE
ncbi:MAG: hypothetical protein AAF458_12435 [Pseudomonadota bacterium]